MKPPQYEEMDAGRERAIPDAFERVCGNLKKYHLVKIPPTVRPNGWVGPLPRSTFEVRDLAHETLVAQFFPNGNYDCHKDDFRPYFDRMVDIIELAGQKAYDRFMEEYSRLRERDS
ncbi:MAG TPA: hypothetical protein VLH13_03460 [Methanomassiliicoccales archaeon]|nr:hypothetical protein [Methanomassiliicoccales archaeon]